MRSRGRVCLFFRGLRTPVKYLYDFVCLVACQLVKESETTGSCTKAFPTRRGSQRLTSTPASCISSFQVRYCRVRKNHKQHMHQSQIHEDCHTATEKLRNHNSIYQRNQVYYRMFHEQAIASWVFFFNVARMDPDSLFSQATQWRLQGEPRACERMEPIQTHKGLISDSAQYRPAFIGSC